MSKKNIFIGIIGIFTLSFLVFPTLTSADQYYLHYAGNGLLPPDESVSYLKGYNSGSMYHNDTSDMGYICLVNFNVPDSSAYFIKSIGMAYKDNLTNGYISVKLKKENLYTGVIYTVAEWSSGTSNASSSIQTASKGTNTGVKLVDTKKFCYWLMVYFYVDGDVNPSFNMRLYQVRIHYGT
jgi:hypothetical protein